MYDHSGVASPGFDSVESCGLDVAYRVFGDGEPLLVIGGGPGDVSDRYIGLCRLLSDACSCVLVDQRGTGRSMPVKKDASTVSISLTLADFEAVREKLGIARWHALGFSYGGFLASAYAERYPESVKSLALLGSTGVDQSYSGHFGDNVMSRLGPHDLEAYGFWSDAKRIERDTRRAYTEIVRAMMPGYFYDRAKALEVSQAIEVGDFDFETGELIDADIAQTGGRLFSSPPAFRGDVLVLQGRQDPLGESTALKLHAHYAGSKLAFVEKAGHYSWIERPVEVKETIVSFVRAARPSGR